jgi:hypothetical protein
MHDIGLRGGQGQVMHVTRRIRREELGTRLNEKGSATEE